MAHAPEEQHSPALSRHHSEGADSDDSPAGSIDVAFAEKASEIKDACELEDVQRLRSLAESHGGLLKDELRRLACKTFRCQPDRLTGYLSGCIY